MYKIKSTVGEVKELCLLYLKQRKNIVKNRRVKYIREHLNDRNIFYQKKFKSVKDVVRYMKKTGALFGTIWSDLWIKGSLWETQVKELYSNIEYLPNNREIWLQEDMSFLFGYKVQTKHLEYARV